MEILADFFSDISSTFRAFFLVAGLAFFWSLESIIPLFQLNYSKRKHAALNIFFTLTTVGVNFVLAFTIWELVQWCNKHSFGVLNLFDAPLWLECLLGLFLLDFVGAYLIHFLEHKVKWMWRFHAIHHMDKQVDATTANRHHPVESIFRLVFTLLAVIITGPPMWLVMLYQSLSVLLSQFNHANMALPSGLDRLISWVLVSPNMHKVHHHFQMPFTDSNYGNIFSLWDNLLRTRKHLDTSSIIYGLDSAYERNEADAIEQLVLPFQDPLSTTTKR